MLSTVRGGAQVGTEFIWYIVPSGVFLTVVIHLDPDTSD
jgi:hypothetical protein